MQLSWAGGKNVRQFSLPISALKKKNRKYREIKNNCIKIL